MPTADLAELLKVDPDLGEDLDEDEYGVATQNSVVRVVTIRPGAWCPAAVGPQERGAFGLLVLEGSCLRRESFAGRRRAEPLGEGDLVRPRAESSISPRTDVSWQALAPMQVALLDRRFATRMAIFPSVVDRLIDRLDRRIGQRGQRQLIAAHPGLPDRLLLTVRQLVDCYGHTAVQGFVLPWRLTQGDLADIVGAARPSVNDSLHLLRDAGILKQLPDRTWWVSRGPVIGLGSLVDLQRDILSKDPTRSLLSAG